MTSIWFTSDQHIGHKLVSELRGFGSTEEHDAALARNWDRMVKPDDTVWVLGDVCVSRPQCMAAWMLARPGHKRLIYGNHDEVHGMHRDSHKNLQKPCWRDTFEILQAFARIRVAGQNVLLSHLPYPGTSEGYGSDGRPFDDRYAQWRLQDLGQILLHGHTHRREKRSTSQCGSLQVHVGLDGWGLTPVHLSQIEEIIGDR